MRFLGGGGSFYLRICRGGGSIVPLGHRRGQIVGGQPPPPPAPPAPVCNNTARCRVPPLQPPPPGVQGRRKEFVKRKGGGGAVKLVVFFLKCSFCTDLFPNILYIKLIKFAPLSYAPGIGGHCFIEGRYPLPNYCPCFLDLVFGAVCPSDLGFLQAPPIFEEGQHTPKTIILNTKTAKVIQILRQSFA